MAGTVYVLPKERFQELLDRLKADGYQVVGPVLRDGAIVYDDLHSVDQIPRGWVDQQEPGRYQLVHDRSQRWFTFTPGPLSLKRFLFPPSLSLFRVRRNGDGVQLQVTMPEPPRYAFVGVRACDLAAVAVQDRVYIDRQGLFSDGYYAAARRKALFIAVECQSYAATCFCSSMGTGPEVNHTADVVLLELEDRFVAQPRSERGAAVLTPLALEQATDEELQRAKHYVRQAAADMERQVDLTDIRDLLLRNLENPRWDQVATRCIACANCTMVCPTCFCFSFQEVTDLTGNEAERRRVVDSCFNPEFSYAFGVEVRQSVASRYRQWLTHKFATWYDQFGVSGCVGCGRCITWCPAGIDVTEELSAIRASDGSRKEQL